MKQNWITIGDSSVQPYIVVTYDALKSITTNQWTSFIAIINTMSEYTIAVEQGADFVPFISSLEGVRK